MSNKKKETILNLEKHLGKKINVKFDRGRDVVGVLRGYDHIANLVLDDVIEYMRDPDDFNKRKTQTVTLADGTQKNVDVIRKLGIVICKGTSVTYICPTEGTHEIDNPFIGDDDDDDDDDDDNEEDVPS